ncbi:hypothetical protein Enr13x_41090 [Stieleria neptunia]|uniref:Chromosome partition protein Smc n=1 Tax=Stieleria neptunia TaxID=2527979 RepID=A0A518HTT2_9BACT|nr:hypothetical protein [Stieleria neptunia]QDV44246.1 hypothetical protein Enr13x_41090 [Stieleria neptunia]
MIVPLHVSKRIAALSLFMGCASIACGAEPPKLVIAAEPRGDATDLNYQLDSSDMTSMFFVRNAGDEEAKNLQLSARLHETGKPHGSTVLQLSSETKRLDDGSLSLGAGQAIPVELKTTSLELGTTTGYVLVEQGEEQFSIGTLTFEYNVAPELKVIGLADGAELQVTAEAPSFQHVLSIQSRNNTPIRELIVKSTRVTGPDGEQRDATVEWMPQTTMPQTAMPIPLAGHQLVDVRVTTELPKIGIYKLTLIISYDTHTLEVPFAITRKKKPLPYEMLSPEAVRTDLALYGPETRVRVTLHELNGLPAKSTALPELVSLHQVVTGQKTYQSTFGEVFWTDDAGTSKTHLALSPGESKSLWLVISGLTAAGEHVGRLQLSLPDGQTVTANVSIIARKHIAIVIVFIVAGIVISQVLKVLGSWALNLEQQEQLLRLDSNAERLSLSPELSREGRSILEELRSRIRIVLADSQANRGKSYADKINELDRKIRLTPRWAAAAQSARAIRPTQPSLLDTADQIKQCLRDDNSSAQELDSNEALVDALERETVTKHREILQQAIAELSSQITRYRELQTLSDESSERLRRVSQDVRLAEKTVAEDTSSAQELYDRARTGYASSLILDVRELVRRPPRVLAPEIDGNRWSETGDRLIVPLDQRPLLARDDPNDALRLVWRVRTNYWSESLRAAIATLREKTRPDQEPPPTDLDELKSRLAELEGFAAKLQQLGTEDNISPESLLGFEQQIDRLGHRAHAPRTLNANMEAGVIAEGVAGNRLLAVLTAVGFPGATDTSNIHLSDIDALRTQRLWNDIWIFVLSGVVAVILGIKLLWVDDLDWGTNGDYLIAVLWGLGLHQVANVSFNFNSLASRLSSPASPGATANG